MNEDASRLGPRLKRYAQVTSAVSGLATRLVGEKYFGLAIDREAHADALKNVLGNLKGPLMKVAQILATVPDVLPPEYAQELAELQSNAPPMGWVFVKRRMSAELGADWQNHFRTFGQTAAAAASLGQVHKAELLTGEVVACKLQYPDMVSIVEADLEQLKWVLSTYETFNKALRTHNMYQEVADRLYEELDYHQEAKHMALYTHMLKPYSFTHVPQTVAHLTTKRLLTMSWLDGKKIFDIKNASQAFRNQVALHLFKTWYTPLYHFGVIHGDPHLGNYTVTPEGHINLLDFGCIRIFKSCFIQGVIDLYTALKTNDWDLAHHAYSSWGFQNITKELLDTLNLWARFLYEPLLDDRVRPIQEGNSGVFGKEVADTVFQKLQALGGVHPPREFVFMDRAAVGIGSVLMHLSAQLNWHALFEELIDGFSISALEQRQHLALEAAHLPRV